MTQDDPPAGQIRPGGISKIKLYSPAQVGVGSFLGGSIASLIMLKRNFDRLNDHAGSRKTVVWGVILSMLIILIVPFLPKHFPGYAIPAANIVFARVIARTYQMTRQAISESDTYAFQSNWNVLGVGAIGLVSFMLALLAWIMVLIHSGILKA